MDVLIAPAAQRQYDALPILVQARVRAVFMRLKAWPRVSGAKPLRGDLAGFYRVRTGDYRVQFRTLPDAIEVTKVGHRDRFYD